eukprot:1261805-Amorphochlora_amoeboformis.AAC.2
MEKCCPACDMILTSSCPTPVTSLTDGPSPPRHCGLGNTHPRRPQRLEEKVEKCFDFLLFRPDICSLKSKGKVLTVPHGREDPLGEQNVSFYSCQNPFPYFSTRFTGSHGRMETFFGQFRVHNRHGKAVSVGFCKEDDGEEAFRAERQTV